MQLNRRVEFRAILKEGETMNNLKGTQSGAPAISAPRTTTTTGTSGTGSTGTSTGNQLVPGKSKVKMADGTKVKTKVDEDSDKVKVKTEGPNGEESKTVIKDGEIDSKVKDADGKTKLQVEGATPANLTPTTAPATDSTQMAPMTTPATDSTRTAPANMNTTPTDTTTVKP